MKILYTLTMFVGLLLAFGSMMMTVSISHNVIISGYLIKNPDDWTINILHTPTAPNNVNSNSAKNAILKGLVMVMPHRVIRSQQTETAKVCLIIIGFSILGLIRERILANRYDSSNKAVVGTSPRGRVNAPHR